jgi:catechol 2,3-dioxygenase-like lactoylglutathione lyase family enzyme
VSHLSRLRTGITVPVPHEGLGSLNLRCSFFFLPWAGFQENLCFWIRVTQHVFSLVLGCKLRPRFGCVIVRVFYRLGFPHRIYPPCLQFNFPCSLVLSIHSFPLLVYSHISGTMPVSHITLTVSHLPTSTSFFLSCLQPLGYQFIGRHDDYIGFGQKQGEPADFWMTETKPGYVDSKRDFPIEHIKLTVVNRCPPGAVHVAFPAPSKDAVGSFFISALKAGAKIHGEPKMRDSQSGYFSAAVIDFDGNSIEAVYRPSVSSAASAVSGPTMALLEDSSRSVVSKATSRASTVKAESIAPRSEAGSVARSEAKSRALSKAPTAIERSAPTVVSRHTQGPLPSHTMQASQASKTDDGSKAAKTIVGTLIGAAAGAAIAYAMVKGDSQSTSGETKSQSQQFPTDFPQIKAAAQSFFGGNNNEEPEPQQLRAIEAPPPPRTVYSSASNPRSALTRSVTSKNPRASTIYEGTEYHDENGRRASEGSIYSIPENTPLRAIEYPPASAASQHRYHCAPSTLISSYVEDKPRNMSAGSIHSASTLKASTARRHSHDDREGYSSVSHRSQSVHSQHTHRSVRISSHAGVGKGKENASVASSKSARNIPLPAGSEASFYSSPSIHSKDIAIGPQNSYVSPHDYAYGGPKDSYISARHVLLPESVLDVDVESHVSPDDSISQAGGRSSHSHRPHRSHHSNRSSHSKREPSAHSKSGSRFDDAVRPADSVSQVSRASQRTVKADGSKSGFKAGSRRGSQAV